MAVVFTTNIRLRFCIRNVWSVYNKKCSKFNSPAVALRITILYLIQWRSVQVFLHEPDIVFNSQMCSLHSLGKLGNGAFSLPLLFFTPATRIAFYKFQLVQYMWEAFEFISRAISHTTHIHRVHGISPAEAAELEVTADIRRQSKQTAVVIMVRSVDIVT